MEHLKYRTKGNVNPQGKPRVYFTCHPKDFNEYFDKIVEDIFATQNCTIYYLEDMASNLPAEYQDTDLNQMNLFVVPVTFALLSIPNRAMDLDVQFAFDKHIPVLPIMCETGIESLYASKFGKLQYLVRCSQDLTEIKYEEKLKKYLSAVLFDNQTAERVRAAFDAYIFLSYRKKDRKYANKLMRLIHSNPICRDIAIWYDEFLVPGEDFSSSIQSMLEKSEIFTLLVTPNLVNEDNYVRSVEYPAALKAKKRILPAEMICTDWEKLKEQYEGIPNTIKAKDEDGLYKILTDAFSSIAVRENDDDPIHNFLIGLAYLDGIDVEINRERAVELITSAADAGLLEAMKKLASMYDEGYGVELDWQKSYDWKFKIAAKCMASLRYQDELPAETLNTFEDLVYSFDKVGEYKKSLDLAIMVYVCMKKYLGEKHDRSLRMLEHMSFMLSHIKDYSELLKICQQTHPIWCEKYGETCQDALRSLSYIAFAYSKLGDSQKSLEISKNVYELMCQSLGNEHPDTLTVLNDLAVSYWKIGNHLKGLMLGEDAYQGRCKILGEKHPHTMISLNNLSIFYMENKQYSMALAGFEKVYKIRCEVLGNNHPETMLVLKDLNACRKKI